MVVLIVTALLCIIGKSDTTVIELLATGDSSLTLDNSSGESHQGILSLSEETSDASPASPTINPDYAAKDCTKWNNPEEYSEFPSAFTRIPGVISISRASTNSNFSLAIVDKYEEQLACFIANVQLVNTSVSVFSGQCGEGVLIAEEVWPLLMDPSHDNWPCLVKPHFPLSDFFHFEISTKKRDQENGKTEINFKLNGELHRALSVDVDSSAEFVHIFATKIETGVNIVYFQDNYTASKCQTLEEPFKWDQIGYFLPEEDATEVKIYISFCHFTEVLIYPVNPKDLQWHKITFGEDLSANISENILFYRNVFIDDLPVANLTITNKQPSVLLRLIQICPLKMAKVSMTKAIWTNKCNLTEIIRTVNSENNFMVMNDSSSLPESHSMHLRETTSSKTLIISGTSDTSLMSTIRPIINPVFAAKDCTKWFNPLEYSDIPSSFTRIPVVISVSHVSCNTSFSFAVVDKYGEQLACFMASSLLLETLVSVSIGQCGHGELVHEEVWPHLSGPNRNDWPCLVKPHFSLHDYFHIEISTQEKDMEKGTTELSFRPNGRSQKALSVNVNSSAEFIYIFATKIETAVNMVYFRDNYTASKCPTLDEPVRWNQEAYFYPEEEATEVKIYISYCHFTEVLTYSINPRELQWHKLSFGEDSSVESLENILFYRNVLIDDKIVGNITMTNEHQPRFLVLIKICPLEKAKVSITKAIWTHKCSPTTMA